MDRYRNRKTLVMSTAPTCYFLLFFMLVAPSTAQGVDYPSSPDGNPATSGNWEITQYAASGGAQCGQPGSMRMNSPSSAQWFGHRFSGVPIQAGTEITFNFDMYCDTGGLDNFWVELWDPSGGATLGSTEFTSTSACTSRSITVTATGNAATFEVYFESYQVGVDRYSWYTDLQITGVPTLVTLSNFAVDPHGTSAMITWETVAEIDTAGFHVWRSEKQAGPYAKITETLIPAEGGPTTGASYSWEDTGVSLGRTYYYKLEDLDTAGVGTFHGPASTWVGAVDIKANAFDGPVSVGHAELCEATIEMNKEYFAGFDGEIWLCCRTPFGWYSCIGPYGWVAGIKPTKIAPAGAVGPIEILDTVLPPGEYVFYFATDNTFDGNPEPDWLDAVEVSVE